MAAPVLNSSVQLSTAGYFRLSWSIEQDQDASSTQYELQQAGNREFTSYSTIYTGADMATVISGLPDRLYFYRVRVNGSNDWSDPVEVEVKHHSLTRAFGFFVLGALMFVTMLVVLIKGARRSASP